MGAPDSITSTGMARTPLGNAVPDSPSWAGRAPLPPLLKKTVSKDSPGAFPPSLARRPRNCTLHRQDEPSAGTRPGNACARHPNTTSGSIWPMT